MCLYVIVIIVINLFLFFFCLYLPQVEETPEEWIQKWKNESHNVRDTDDFVQDLSSRIINAQKILLQRKRINGN